MSRTLADLDGSLSAEAEAVLNLPSDTRPGKSRARLRDHLLLRAIGGSRSRGSGWVSTVLTSLTVDGREMSETELRKWSSGICRTWPQERPPFNYPRIIPKRLTVGYVGCDCGSSRREGNQTYNVWKQEQMKK